jgi:CRISPR-associated endonuclease Csn1
MNVGPELNEKRIEKVIDVEVRRKLMERFVMYDRVPEKAFSNLDNDPIYLDRAKKIIIKSVKISGVSNALALHEQMDKDRNLKPKDWVSTGNNHHVAIYEDENGDYQDEVVSFFTAVTRAISSPPQPIIQKYHENGWKFLFTMKINELFVFPSKDFYPAEIDLTDPSNYPIISKHLFRVQKLSSRYYCFRHHLETNVEDTKELKDVTWKRIVSNNHLRGVIKIRINHLGQIVQTGEY